MVYNLEYANIHNYKETSSTLDEFVHNLYIATDKTIDSWAKDNEYEFVCYLLGRNSSGEMLELMEKYDEKYFASKSLAVAGFEFNSGGVLEYKSANVIFNTITIKYKWNVGLEDYLTNHIIVVEIDKNIEEIKV